MALKPLGDRVIIKRDEAETTTSFGLVLANDSKEKPCTGIVIAVGPGRLDKDGKVIPMLVKAGDKVLYSKYGGSEVSVDGEDMLIVRADEIFGVFE